VHEKTRQRYARTGAEIVAAVLQTISLENAGPIWQAVSSSSTINMLFGISEVTMADQRYLNVLAESYKNASSLETGKQILYIMTDLPSYSVISSFIPGITKHRYTAAKYTSSAVRSRCSSSFPNIRSCQSRFKRTRPLFIIYN
jgi:hypothetical protein